MIEGILLILTFSIIGVGIYSYNRLVSLKNYVEEAWSGIDVQLKRRHNLIPNLVETVKGYAGLEKNTLEEITRIRTEVSEVTNTAKRSDLESTISIDMKKLFALAEAYPDLKANNGFLKLQEQLSEIEDHIQYARRYYNGTVRNFNIAVDSIPSNFVARFANFAKEEFFEIEFASERVVPVVKT